MTTKSDLVALEEDFHGLERTWRDPSGVIGWLRHVDHKSLGRRYLVTAFGFFLLGGALAALMRLQLSRPDNHIVGPDLYNQLFTTHGTTMMFLFAVPVMQGLGIHFLPLMVGARAIAFPRLVAYSYWMFLFGGIFLYVSFFLNAGPDVGWFSYPPLAEQLYTPSKRADVWAQLITFTEVASLAVAVSLITTAFKLRTPGMTLNRVPIFVWAQVVTSFMVLFAMPSVMLASTALILDRLVSTHFFNPAEGGDALLWQHLFWFFGHPEVYFIFIPGLAFMSAIIPTFSRRPIFGYPAIVMSLTATAFLSFGLWVHHMFATHIPELGKSFFTAASMLIALPTATQIFCWIATMWTGRLLLATPMLYTLAFFFILVLGGMTGLMVASVPLDLQLTDTYFVVAHLHYVLIGGAVFPLFGAWFYWFPKITGRMMSERLGKWQFWLFFVGFNVAFYPMHHLGLKGMPRRVYTYSEASGWGDLNLLATLGAATIALSMLLFVVNVWASLRRPPAAPQNPWGGGTLEWATSSPPCAYNFDRQPIVRTRDPLWEPIDLQPSEPTHVLGLAETQREALITTVLDAVPDHRLTFPSPSIWPFVSAIAVTVLFLGSIFTPWAVVWGAIPVAIAVTLWFWPKPAETETHLRIEKRP